MADIEVGARVSVDQAEGVYYQGTVVGFQWIRCPVVEYDLPDNREVLVSFGASLDPRREPVLPGDILPENQDG